MNHVLGRKVQHTGVAPTDDSFTVIAGGNSDMDQDGRAIIVEEPLARNATLLTSTQNTDLLWETQIWGLRVFDVSVRRF